MIASLECKTHLDNAKSVAIEKRLTQTDITRIKYLDSEVSAFPLVGKKTVFFDDSS